MKLAKKKIVYYILMITCVMGVIGITPQNTQAATKAALKSKLQATTSEPIRKYICEDLNGDGKKEALAITSKVVDDLGYIDAKVWYVTDNDCKMIQSCDGWALYPKSVEKCKVKNTWIVSFDVGAGGSRWMTYAYSFDKYGAQVVNNVGVGLTYLGKNRFAVLDSRFDACIDGTGHTWNCYYSKWDGEKLVEYGGLKISQTQLKKAKNGANILKQIKKKGKIGDIYYRANGLIFVNYTNGNQNYNVALKLKNGKVSYYDQGGSGKTKMEKATQSGVIYKSITSCVEYPKNFPVK
ncbi:MAG: hypothetical protein J6C00_01850 [Eubacterium sp.]|nr:hypothetical protein [Eubacterium sp.]